MRRCEDEKMFYRPPLLEEPCAQTLSGKMVPMINNSILIDHSKTFFHILSTPEPRRGVSVAITTAFAVELTARGPVGWLEI